MAIAPSHTEVVDLGELSFDSGGHLLVVRALRSLTAGDVLEVRGSDPNLEIHLRSWCRQRGHKANGRTVVRGSATDDRWKYAQRAGESGPGAIAGRADASWGLAARGALIEPGGPALAFADLDTKSAIWSSIAPKLYAQAAASQWDPATAINWDAPCALDEEIETAVVQVMTYLIENEQAALLVPARFIGRVHPHYRETLQFLATQLADEARHIEVFTRRALLHRSELGTSSVGGRTSLQTLLDEPDFSIASFLLSVLGEGTFLHLLSFLEMHSPDPITAQICHFALQDEARHVAFGLAHLEEQLATDPDLRNRLAAAVERRFAALSSTAGLNEEVLDALVLLAAGSWDRAALARGWSAVAELQHDMAQGRLRRLKRLGFSDELAMELSTLHTRNFM